MSLYSRQTGWLAPVLAVIEIGVPIPYPRIEPNPRVLLMLLISEPPVRTSQFRRAAMAPW